MDKPQSPAPKIGVPQPNPTALGDDTTPLKARSAPARAAATKRLSPPPPPTGNSCQVSTAINYYLRLNYVPSNIQKIMHVKSASVTVGQLIMALQTHLRQRFNIETNQLNLSCKRHKLPGYYLSTQTVVDIAVPPWTILYVEPRNDAAGAPPADRTVDPPRANAEERPHQQPQNEVGPSQNNQDDTREMEERRPNAPGGQTELNEADITATEYNIKLPEDWGALTVWYEAWPVRPKEPEPDKDLRLIFRMGEPWTDIKKQNTSQAATTPTVEAMVPTAPVLPKVTELQQVNRISANEQTTTQYVKVHWPEWKYVRGPTDPTPSQAELTPPMRVLLRSPIAPKDQLVVCDPPGTRPQSKEADITDTEYNIKLPEDWGALTVRYVARPVRPKEPQPDKDLRLIFRMGEPWGDLKKQSTSQAATNQYVKVHWPKWKYVRGPTDYSPYPAEPTPPMQVDPTVREMIEGMRRQLDAILARFSNKDVRLVFRMSEPWADIKKQSTSQAATTPTVEAMVPTAPVLPKVTELQKVNRISANEQTTTQYVKVHWPQWKYVRGPTDPTPSRAEFTPPMRVLLRSPIAPKDQLVVCDPPGSRPQSKEADITDTEYNIKLPEDWGALTVWYEARPIRPKEPEPDKDLRLIFRMGEPWGDLKKQSTSQAATTPTVEAMIPTAPVLPKVTELQQVDRISANEQTTTQYVKVHWPEWKYVRGPTDPTPSQAEPNPPMPEH